ncbi:uncharacterized protein BO72DRAFT_473176 [Aspergillus fijiensis CBS 313.89]|uniref:Uncharacterized protein n=1 Tax=Aspergillus fijiensis CBS 313.89 TaxID=1448319 RepID=A0A8G1VTY1_9EURO|nr:uncharacterized protein BO72DRAFT_473176 [Aspergillus fijiensis CBS 313.89]RAK71536.1 hypothetical protein BO72DRAFT_473176 [Aspergillus fijiensis CBS 313.89]
MYHQTHRHQHRAFRGTHLGRDVLSLRPDIVPRDRLRFLAASPAPTLLRRDPAPSVATATATSTCGGNSCEKSTSTMMTTTLPVVLGVVIPVVCAIAVLLYFHRKNVKKLRNEDANDKHKSLDFGLDLTPTGTKPMQQAEKTNGAHAKGVSLDIGPSPYLLPPGLHNSRESLQSLSRSMIGDDDKYRHATSFLGDNASLRSHSRGPQDDASSFAGSTRRGPLGDDMNQGLLRNAQRMSRSSPPLYDHPESDRNTESPSSPIQNPQAQIHVDLSKGPNSVHVSGVAVEQPASSSGHVKPSPSIGSSNNDPPSLILPSAPLEQSQDPELFLPSSSVAQQEGSNSAQDAPAPLHASIPIITTPHVAQITSTPTPRISLPVSDAASDYGDAESSHAIPSVDVHGVTGYGTHSSPEDVAYPFQGHDASDRVQNASLDHRRDTRRLTFGLRPLPPEDPSDNPEQRANRIRSFYKEYFDESRTGRDTYYGGAGPEAFAEGGYVYDPSTGEHFSPVPAPFAEPVTRRAMTPPPRAPPRFQGAAHHMATGSDGGFGDRFNSPGLRAFSSASGRLPGPPKPRKPAPPPSPLQILPTPHMLKDESIMTAIDYAPSKNYKDLREGRPDTPLGGLQPFSPLTPARSPLVSAFDDLSPLPSAHALRKSGAYDTLDFAPPPRFKNTDAGSDAGSIRSNHTGISSAHLHNIRSGAYRVSRLPPGTVGTKDDLISNLRPKWDMQQ